MNKTNLDRFTSQSILLNLDNIDTDQIIPARFLKTISKQGLGKHLFADWRYDEQGNLISDFVLNKPGSENAEILITGSNFGCGSSREHAPWALKSYGFHAVIATSFADIFTNNAVKNGLLPIRISQDSHDILIDTLEEVNDLQITIDLPAEIIILPTGIKLNFDIDSFSKKCILEGMNELDYLLSNLPEIAIFESERD